MDSAGDIALTEVRSMQLEIILNALILTVVGMGFVFFFLAIQVFVTNMASKLGARFAYLLPEPEKKKPAPAKAADDGALIAAIVAAVHQQAN